MRHRGKLNTRNDSLSVIGHLTNLIFNCNARPGRLLTGPYQGHVLNHVCCIFAHICLKQLKISWNVYQGTTEHNYVTLKEFEPIWISFGQY